MEFDKTIDDLVSAERPLAEEDDVVAMAVRRLTTEPLEVLSKGLNPSRFDSWHPGARSKVARQYGSATDLVLEVLKRATPTNDEAAADLRQLASEAFARDMPVEEVVRVVAGAHFDMLCSDDRLALRVAAWRVARERPDVAKRLGEWYEHQTVANAEVIVAGLGTRRLRFRAGINPVDLMGTFMQMLEGAVPQTAFLASEVVRERYVESVLFTILNAIEEDPTAEQ